MASQWERSEAGVLLPRRRLLQGAAAAGATLALPGNAEALIPWLAIGRFVAATAISWAIGKVLDHFWDGVNAPKADPIKRHISNTERFLTTPSETTRRVEARFGTQYAETGRRQTLLEAREASASTYRVIPMGFLKSMDIIAQEEASPSAAFNYWGSPDDVPLVGSPLEFADGGTLIGLWWGKSSTGRRRFVVIRTTVTKHAGYIPCLGNYAETAHKVVSQGQVNLAGDRLKRLIRDPTAHVYDPDDDAPARTA